MMLQECKRERNFRWNGSKYTKHEISMKKMPELKSNWKIQNINTYEILNIKIEKNPIIFHCY